MCAYVCVWATEQTIVRLTGDVRARVTLCLHDPAARVRYHEKSSCVNGARVDVVRGEKNYRTSAYNIIVPIISAEYGFRCRRPVAVAATTRWNFFFTLFYDYRFYLYAIRPLIMANEFLQLLFFLILGNIVIMVFL